MSKRITPVATCTSSGTQGVEFISIQNHQNQLFYSSTETFKKTANTWGD